MKLLQFDANFFQERAMRSLDRYHYDKALKYFRKAVDYEPNNPINYCNIAGVLSEIGKYGESNQLLRKVIEEIAPEMTECHFYMANNFANMESFEEAERELLQYLQEDEEGQFLEEAEEMIEFLELELERPTPLTKVKARAGVFEHERARELLEEGKFIEGIMLLESISEENPEFYAARNNLALAYYYIGRNDQAKATLEQVLQKDPNNLHALCNLAIFLYYEGNSNELSNLSALLCKLTPFYREHLFKLATTMGILKEHAAALRHFQRLTNQGEAKKDPCISHFAAIAACNVGKYHLAEKYWQMTASLEHESALASFCLILISRLQHSSVNMTLSYSYLTKIDEQVEIWLQQVREQGGTHEIIIKQSYLLWALQHGSKASMLEALNAIDGCCDAEVVKLLLDAVHRQDLDDEVKRVIIFTLRSAGITEPLSIVLNGKQVMVEAERMPSIDHCFVQQCNPDWEAVAEILMKQTANRYSALQRHDMVTLWVNFLTKHYASLAKMTKLEAWAAAIEYVTAKLYSKSTTYHEVSLRYGTSISTVSKRVKEIDAVLNVRGKMNDTLSFVKLKK